MRFSIRPDWGFDKYRAEVGSATITIRRVSWLLVSRYRWSWTDAQLMSLEVPGETSSRLPVLNAGDAVYTPAMGTKCVMGPSTGWEWAYGDQTLSHRAAYRRRYKTWRAWWRARPRHVLELGNGTTVAAWYGEGNHRQACDGVIRSSISYDLVRVVFGIIMCVYLSERTTKS
jgi:hypothetical protein